MNSTPEPHQIARFGVFEVDLFTGEIRKAGMKQKISGQPWLVLKALLERPQEVVTREDLRARLWPDNTFVDYDLGLKKAVNRLREALGDSADSPRFIETLPRQGYRFIAPVSLNGAAPAPVEASAAKSATELDAPRVAAHPRWLYPVLIAGFLVAVAGVWVYARLSRAPIPTQRSLTRLTFDEGLQYQPTWSPDGRAIAYSSNRGGQFDIWVQQIGAGNPVQLTKRPGLNWQPDWSPDGKYIAYRSEDADGGLYIVPAVGGEGLERKISSFGYFPKWSPNSSQILFVTRLAAGIGSAVYVVGLDGDEPRLLPTETNYGNWAISAVWHPDGKRISTWTWLYAVSEMPVFSTYSVNGTATPIRTQFGPELLRSAADVDGSGLASWAADPDFKFAWAPTGAAIYFERTFRGARNIWRASVEPRTLQATSIERLTTGTDQISDFSLSPNGRSMAFASETRKVQTWMFPFDAKNGHVTGNGKAVTSPSMEAWELSLSPGGDQLAFQGIRAGRWELWRKLLVDNSETPISPADNSVRDEPRWSPDGTRLAYVRTRRGCTQAMIWSKERGEEPLTTCSAKNPNYILVFDWSRDGKSLLFSRANPAVPNTEIWEMPASGSDPIAQAHKLVSCNRQTYLWQGSFSPDGRWILFEAEENRSNHLSTIYVTPAAGGGRWTRITDSKHWDDKPRWSPDGKTIYYVSDRKGFFNVWGAHFDGQKGLPEGDAFQVTHFDSPKLMIAEAMPAVGLGVSKDKLVVTTAQVSGNIWLLDNADR